MRIKILLLVIFIINFISLSKIVLAEELRPYQYTVEDEIENEIVYYLDGSYYATVPEGWKMREGDKIGYIKLIGKLTFWNVGEKGNSFLGTEDYSKAKLILDVIPTNDGWQVFKAMKNNPDLLTVEKVNWDPKHLEFDLKFTGYSNGEFYTDSGKKVGLVNCDDNGFCVIQMENWYLNDLFDGNYIFNESYETAVRHGAFTFDLPASVFQVHCPFECETDSHKLPVKAVIDDMGGEVEVIRCGAGEDDWFLANIGTIIHSGDCVRTGEDTKVKLVFDDMTSVILGEETEVHLTYRYQKSVLQLFMGRLWETGKHMIKGGNPLDNVEMPEAVAGIKGTSFIAIAEPYENSVVVFDGEVEVNNKRTNEVTNLTKNQKMLISYNGESEFFDNIDKEKEIDNFYKRKSNWQWYILLFSSIIFIVYIFLKKLKTKRHLK